MTRFGELLRDFRNRCDDPNHPERRLTQQRIGELIGMELGHQGFSGAAVSDWERGVSKIHADQRIVLIGIVKILNQYGGIKSLVEATQLLEAGNYRALNPDEAKEIFHESAPDPPVQSAPAEPMARAPGHQSLRGNFFFEFPQEIQSLLEKAKDGPPPIWPRVMVAVFRRYLDRLSLSNAWTFILWIWVWLLAWALIAPSLRWPFLSRDEALAAVVMYAVGSIIIPALIGALTNTKDNEFWKDNESVKQLNLRLYTHQGASIGFHVGYFFVFMFGLLIYNLDLQLATWLELIVMVFPIIMGYAGARLVPHNLLRAYKQLSLKDGAIFFIFFLLGPAWGYFFLQVHDILLTQTLGVLIFLSAITILLAMMVFRYRQSGTTVIPVYWWVIFFGSIMLCQILTLLVK